MSIRNNYKHTQYASYLGYITQAIVNNFIPLLFLTLQREYAISLDKITLLVTINFCMQLLVDFLSVKFVDRIGYRTAIVMAHIFSAVGLAGLGIFPEWFANPYAGILLAIFLYAIGGGLIEVLISPIVEACPTDNKSGSMSLLHSFYCWGHCGVVLLSTAFFVTIGITNWHVLCFLWALIPLVNAIYFMMVPINTLTQEGEGMTIRELNKTKIFWIFFVLMICAGASEQAMSQWASAFAESGLHVSKTIGDLAGPCMFAILMGTSRALYAKLSEKIELIPCMIGSGILCMGSYLLAVFAPSPLLALAGCGICGFSVGILWPGSFSLAAAKCPRGGTAMFALLALAGDVGCSGGPTLVGLVSNTFEKNMRAGLFAAIIFPILLIAGLILTERHFHDIRLDIKIEK